MFRTSWLMLSRVCYFLFAILLLCQCKDKSIEEQQLDKQFDEVMVIHDDVMPKMTNIHRLKKQLKKLQSSNADLDLEKIVGQLDAADEGMMDWMHAFKKPKGKSFDEAMKYLEDEKLKISSVKQDMLEAISAAEAALK